MAERAGPSREELEREVARLTRELAGVREEAERSERLAGKRDLQSRQDLGLILGSMPAMLIGVGRDGRITQWNDCAASAFGFPAEQAVGRYFPECGIDWDWTRLLACRDQVIERQCCLRLHDIDYRRSDRRAAVLALTLVWVGAGDSDLELLLFMLDTTARRQQQAQSMQSMKLEAIGQLAAGIAHEINTPLQYVGDNVAFFREFTEELFRSLPPCSNAWPRAVGDAEAIARLEPAYHQAEIPKALRQSADGVERIASIVSALKEFSHPDGTDPVLIDLNRCLENAAAICRNEYKMVADLKLELSKETLSVSCFPQRPQQGLHQSDHQWRTRHRRTHGERRRARLHRATHTQCRGLV